VSRERAATVAALEAAAIPASKLGPARHPQVRGAVISMQEAAAAGRAVFGDVQS
jgi:hypothetical protein